MSTIIEGIATISKHGFRFNSGLPSNEPVLDNEITLHGTAKIKKNGSMTMKDNRRTYVAPINTPIYNGDGFWVKRTSSNYIVQIKFPVIESRKDSEDRINEMLPTIMGNITLDRKELIGEILPDREAV